MQSLLLQGPGRDSSSRATLFRSLSTQFKSAVEPPKTFENTYTFPSAQAVLRVVMFPLVSGFTHSSYTYSFSLHSYNIVREQSFVL